MPKVIDVTPEQILSITQKLIEEKRFEQINCRNIAKEAGIGVGTLYHYFSSKGEILALVILSDWRKALNAINTETTLEEGLRSVYEAVYHFSSSYRELWDYEKVNSTRYVDILTNHEKVISPIKESIKKILAFNHLEVNEEHVDFVSENLVRYSSKLWDYSKLEDMFILILGGKTNG